MTLRYVTGTARALVRGGTVVVLPGPADDALVEQVWDQLGADPGVVEVLQVLTGAFGSSLRTIPPFAVAVVSGRRVHVAVRGALAVTLELDGGERVHADGEDVTTWSERVVEGVVELLVRTGVAPAQAPRGEPLLASASGDVASFPLASGVVLADAVAWQLAERPAMPVPDPIESGAELLPGLGTPPGDASRSTTGVEDAPAADRETPSPVSAAPGASSAPVGVLGATLRLPEETITPEPEGADATDEPLGASLDADAAAGSEASTAADAESSSDAAGADEEPDDYAHLWGSTVLRTVEDAAVRAEAEDEHADDVPPVPGPPAPEVDEGPADASDADPAPAPPQPEGGLIAGVPREWTGATPAAAHRAATVVDPEVDPAGDAGAEGLDHDGHTVLSSAIADLRAAAQSTAPPAPPAPTPSFTAAPGPGQQQILARTCAQGHANPPSRDTCALCGSVLEEDAALAIRPPLGRVVVSTGQTVELDRPVVVGRRPRTPRTQASDLPRLVTVPSPQQDISRSHVEITLEGWHVLVSDMATTNGTTLLRAGQPPRRLHPSEPVLVVDGDVADLGDGVTLTFEGIR